MAVWQADFILVPSKYGTDITKELRRDHEWWAEREFPKNYEEIFQSLFTKSQSWAAEIELFGEEAGNIISVATESGRVTECFARFDLRFPVKKEYKTFLEFCVNNDISLLNEQNEIIQADGESFRKSLLRSSAFRFVKDPEEFIRNISEKKKIND